MYDTSVYPPQSDCFLSAGYVENPSEVRISYFQQQKLYKDINGIIPVLCMH